MIALFLLIILQIADGLFSIHGIKTVGLEYEINTLLGYFIKQFGVVETIFTAKLLSCFLGITLYKWKEFSKLWFVIGLFTCNLYNQIMFFFSYSG